MRVPKQTEMALTPLLIYFILFTTVSQAVWRRATVMEGATLTLSCPIRNAHRSHVEWKNPEGYVMFFNHHKALRDRRYSICKLSETEFTISVSDVTFKDAGNFTCLHYNQGVIEKIVEVTVLGLPKMEVEKHRGKTMIKCTAEGSHYPPQIYWGLGNSLEIAARPHHLLDNGISKYTSSDTLHVEPLRKRVTVKCIVRHPALHGQPLMNFVEIRRKSIKFPRRTSTRSPVTQPVRSTTTTTTTNTTANTTVTATAAAASWPGTAGTTVQQTARDWYGSSSEGSVPSSSETEAVTSFTGSYLSTMTDAHLNTIVYESETSVSASITTQNDTISNGTSADGWSLATEIAENTSHNGTTGNNTRGSVDELERQSGTGDSASLLVFLVVCLILALLVVVIFFGIKLRRAHIIWKRENDDSEQSVESNKSKSSHEEKQSQGRWSRGLFNIGFTQYVIEEPRVISTLSNKTSVSTAESIKEEEAPEPPSTPQTHALDKTHIKETEL